MAEASMKPNLSSPRSCHRSETFSIRSGRAGSTPTLTQRVTDSSALFRCGDCRHPGYGSRRGETMRWLLARLHVLPRITTPASLLDWWLRLAGRKPRLDGLRRPSIRVSESPGAADARWLAEAPENGCAAKHTTEAWCRVAPSDRRLLSPRFSDGRPGPVLDAVG